jgi:hypothetical protein
MRYLLTSNIDPSLVSTLPADQREALMGRFVSYTTALAESGVLRGAEHLLPADTATTVRNRDGQTLLTDGPMPTSSRAFGGYWIVESADLDGPSRTPGPARRPTSGPSRCAASSSSADGRPSRACPGRGHRRSGVPRALAAARGEPGAVDR